MSPLHDILECHVNGSTGTSLCGSSRGFVTPTLQLHVPRGSPVRARPPSCWPSFAVFSGLR